MAPDTEPGAGDDGLRLTWLGHSTVVLDVAGVRLLTDPLLRRHAGPLRRGHARPDADVWSDPDAVLLSHLHHDHAELRSLRKVPRAPVLTSPANAAWLRRRGIAGGRGLAEGEWYAVGGPESGVEVRLVEAVHHSRPMPHRPNDADGHLVRAPGVAVWLAGDTGLYDALADLPTLAGAPLDLAVVPVWGWGPNLSGGHLDPEDAAVAVARTGARWAVPVHWGTLHPPLVRMFGRRWFDEPGERFAEALARHAPESEAVVLAPGGSTVLPLG